LFKFLLKTAHKFAINFAHTRVIGLVIKRE